MVQIAYGYDILVYPSVVIGQQVNCKGVMGAGLAKSIRDKYPIVYTEYRNAVERNKNLLGHCQLVRVQDNKIVANLFGQYSYGRIKKVYTDYNALKNALIELINMMQNNKIYSVALPYGIGAGLAGGNWSKIYEIILGVFYQAPDITLTICKLEDNNPHIVEIF